MLTFIVVGYLIVEVHVQYLMFNIQCSIFNIQCSMFNVHCIPLFPLTNPQFTKYLFSGHLDAGEFKNW